MRLPGTRDALLGGLASAALIAMPALAKEPPASAPPRDGPQADFPMVVGQPYQIGGVTFVPSDSMNFDSVGYASVSTDGGTAITAAHHTLPVPSYAEVTDLASGRTILVRVDRRGPMDGSHAIELSPGAAAQLGIPANGKAAVRVRRVNPPEAERALLRAGQPAPERMATPKPLLDVLQRKLNPALAQRTLDNADDDAGGAAGPVRQQPATMTPKPVAAASVPVAATPKAGAMPKAGAAPKPVVATKGATTTVPPAKPVAPDGPPKGYIPSVPAPADKVAVETKPSPAKSKPVHGVKPAEGSTTKGEEPAKKAETLARTSAKPETASTGNAAGSFIVQAGAFSDKARAQAVADKTGGTLSQSGKVWRVRVGPYAGHALAEAALAKVKSAGYSDARIQRAE